MSHYINGDLVRYSVIKRETLTVSTTAIVINYPTGTLPQLVAAQIEVQGQPVRYRYHGSVSGGAAPTASAGHAVAAATTFVVSSDFDALKFIRDSTATADSTLEITYFGA